MTIDTHGVPYRPSFVVAQSLDDLHGPASGKVTLPNHLLWNPSRPFDLSDEQRHRSMLRIVLREARSQDDLSTYVDRDILVRLWPSLGIPDYIGRAWEARFPELAELTRQESTARLRELQQKLFYAEHRRILYADEHPEALQDLADPTIRLWEGELVQEVWSMPAGWVRLVNRLHADLVDLVGDYEVTDASQKAGGLRFRISPIARGEVADRIRAAREQSWTVCELCGEAAERSMFSTRCQVHARSRTERIPGAIARPPGWVPGAS